MQEQIVSPHVITTRGELRQALSDLEFYGNLALTKDKSIEMELWSERGAIVPAMERPKNADPALFAQRR